MGPSTVGIYTLGGLLYIPPLGGIVNHLVQLYILVYHLETHTLTYTQSNAHTVTWSKIYHNNIITVLLALNHVQYYITVISLPWHPWFRYTLERMWEGSKQAGIRCTYSELDLYHRSMYQGTCRKYYTWLLQSGLCV